MRTAIDLLRNVSVLVVALSVATCKGDTGATGPAGATGATGDTGATGPQGPPGVVWKAAAFQFIAAAAVGATKDVVAITFNAPSSGFVWVQASGYCNVTQGSVQSQAALGWSTVSAGTPTIPNSAFIRTFAHSEASASTQIPYAVAAVFAVAAGSRTIYLTEHTYTVGVSDCSGTSILMFSSSLLPISFTSGAASSTNGIPSRPMR